MGDAHLARRLKAAVATVSDRTMAKFEGKLYSDEAVLKQHAKNANVDRRQQERFLQEDGKNLQLAYDALDELSAPVTALAERYERAAEIGDAEACTMIDDALASLEPQLVDAAARAEDAEAQYRLTMATTLAVRQDTTRRIEAASRLAQQVQRDKLVERRLLEQTGLTDDSNADRVAAVQAAQKQRAASIKALLSGRASGDQPLMLDPLDTAADRALRAIDQRLGNRGGADPWARVLEARDRDPRLKAARQLEAAQEARAERLALLAGPAESAAEPKRVAAPETAAAQPDAADAPAPTNPTPPATSNRPAPDAGGLI